MSEKTYSEVQIEKYKRLVDMYHRLKIPYKATEYTSSVVIEPLLSGAYKTQTILTNIESRLDGVHIIYLVDKCVRKRVERGLYVPMNTDNARMNSKTVFYNEDALVDLMKKGNPVDIVGLDINACYFNTLYNLGAIDEKVYNAGFKKQSEYKDARNAAIGCLSKRGNITIFDGEKDVCETKHSDTSVVRLDVVDTVYNIALSIARELGDGFLYYLTDCFFVLPEYESRCRELIDEYQYTCKRQEYKLLKAEIDYDNRHYFIVNWQYDDAPIAKYNYNRMNHYLGEQKHLDTGKKYFYFTN